MKTAADFRRAELRRKLKRELRLMAFYSDRRRLHKDLARILRRTLKEERKRT